MNQATLNTQDADEEVQEDVIDAKMDEIWNEKPEELKEETTEPAALKEAVEKVEAEKPDEGKEEEEKEPEKEPEEKQDPEKEAVESSTLTLSEIAEVFGADESNFDVDDDGKVVFRTKIDGIEGKVNVAEALKSYQLEGHLNKQNMEVVDMRKALTTERETFQQEQITKTQQLEDTLSLAVNELNRDYQAVNWDQLKVTDPQEYLVLKQDFQDRQVSLQTHYQTLHSEREQQAKVFHEDRVAKVQDESAKLRQLVPGWDNDEAYKAGTEQVRTILMDVGFSSEEVEQASNGLSVPPEMATRIFLIAHESAMYRKLKESQAEVIKKVRKAPKVVKAGVSEDKSSKTTLKHAVDTVKKSGGEKGLDEYLEAKGII